VITINKMESAKKIIPISPITLEDNIEERAESEIKKRVSKPNIYPIMKKIQTFPYKFYIKFEVPSRHQAVVMYDNCFYKKDNDLNNLINIISKEQDKKAKILAPTKSARSLTYKRDIFLIHTGSRLIDPFSQEATSRDGIKMIIDTIGEYQIVYPGLLAEAYAGINWSPKQITENLEARLKSIIKGVASNFVSEQNYPIQTKQNLKHYFSDDQRELVNILGVNLRISIENFRKIDTSTLQESYNTKLPEIAEKEKNISQENNLK